MSGHSHFATIKRKKEVTDAAKGKMFSRMSRAIQIAIKTGGGPDPSTNYKLRMAIDSAKSVNMPKSNIDRILARSAEASAIDEVNYEGYGPEGVGVVVEVATDNKNRTAQEIKNIFERGGGTLAGPGAVSYNFESKGLLIVKKLADGDAQMLTLIDAGVDDIEESDDVLEVYVAPNKTGETKEKLETLGFEVTSFQLIKQPKSYMTIADPAKASKVLGFLNNLEEHDDVQNVFANVDIPESVLNQINV
jgi:YebC/PmpR family DNA-binding regulatory protein